MMRLKIFTKNGVIPPLFFISIFLLASAKIHCNDAWLHLNIGKIIWETKGIPKTEPFVYTNFTQAFSYTSWLFAVVIYLLQKLWGAAGLVIFKSFCVTTAFFFLFYDSLRPYKNIIVSVFFLTIAAILSQYRFLLKADLCLMVYFSFTIFAFNAFLYEKKKYIYFLPFILFLWGNTHSSINLIFVPIGAFTVGSIIQQFLEKKGITKAPYLTKQQIIELLIVFIVSFVFSLINPNTINQYLAGVNFMGVDYYKQEILELQPVKGKVKIIAIFIDIFIFFSFFLKPKKFSVIHFLLTIPFLILPFLSYRFLFLLPFVGFPIFIRNISAMSFFKGSNFKLTTKSFYLLSGWICLYTILAMTHIMPFGLMNKNYKYGLGYDYINVPNKVVEFLDKENIEGRIYNRYQDGQYLLWTGFPKRTVFIDGRGGLPPVLLEKINLPSQFIDELFDLYKFETFIDQITPLTGQNKKNLELKIDNGFSHPDWALVFWNDKYTVHLRRSGKYKNVIEKHEYKVINPNSNLHKTWASFIGTNSKDLIKNELLRNIKETGSLRAYFYLGALYYSSENYSDAVYYLKKATYSPIPDIKNNAFTLLGDVNFSMGNYDESLANYSETILSEKVPGIQYNIGVILKQKGKTKNAIKQFEKTLKIDPLFLKTYPELVATYLAIGQKTKANDIQKKYTSIIKFSTHNNNFETAILAHKRGDFDLAIYTYKKILLNDPNSPILNSNLGYAYLDKNQLKEAESFMLTALRIDNKYANAYYGLGLIYKKNGNKEKAIENFLKYCDLEEKGYFYRNAKRLIEELKSRTPDST